MSAPVVLEVAGVPAPQGSKTAFVRGNRAVVVEGKGPGRQRHADWRQAVATAARDWCVANGSPPPLDGPVHVTVDFWLPRPVSLPKWRWLPWTRPDLDKLIRATLDSLSGVVVSDDARVVWLAASKNYAVDRAPGCRVAVYDLDERGSRPAAAVTAMDESASA